MSVDEDDVFLVFVEMGETPLTKYGIAQAVGADPHDPNHEVGRLVHAMVKADVLAEFDVESDALEGVLIEHEKYGTLENDDLTFLDVDSVFCIGPAALEYVDKNKSQLMERAANRGLQNALSRLKDLRIDSASWTGLPAGFSFTPQVQAKVIRLLGQAIDEMDRSPLGNNVKAQAGAYLRAALILAEAPDPQPDLIAELLRRLRYVGEAVGFLSSVAGLLGVFGLS